MHPSDPPARFDRRTLIVGSAAAVVLAACGGGDGEGSGVDADDTFSLIQRYPSNIALFVPGPIRLPFSLARDADFVDDGPAELAAQLVDIDGNPIGEPTTAVRRDVTPGPYYAFDVTVDAPGVYGLVVETGPETGANFQVFDPADVVVPLAGQRLDGFDTPTVDDDRGVDPICTREPNCPFHTTTLTDALATGRPVAYFVGTPAFCRTGSCTPALEALVAIRPDFADVEFVHAEVYTNLEATDLTGAVNAVSLLFEPSLFLVGADGTIVDRLDGLWDESELRERIAVLV